jgi:hypothetical protein
MAMYQQEMYLREEQVSLMADAAVRSYEMTGDWSAAIRAAREYAVDEFGVRPNQSVVLLARKIAAVRWMAISQKTHREIGAF